MSTPDITVSLEWAKKMKEAGWPQEGCVHYIVCYSDGTFHKFWTEDERRRKWTGSYQKRYPCYAAPTAEEILRRLPNLIISYIPTNETPILVMNNKSGKQCLGLTLADCLAEMYCYLSKHHLL